jgi:mercuric transport protein
MRNGSEHSNKWSIFGSLGAALAAAVCCLGPLVLVSFGVTGAWIGNLSALEPYRPLSMVVAAGLLGFGFYRVYGPPSQGQPVQEDCGEGAECEVPKANRINQVSLWIATVVVGGLFASPYLLGIGLDDAPPAQPAAQPTAGAAANDSSENQSGESRVATVDLQVSKMTCGGCARSVQTALMDVDGVEAAEVTYDPPIARVTYDSSQTAAEKLTEATAKIGYPSKLED